MRTSTRRTSLGLMLVATAGPALAQAPVGELSLSDLMNIKLKTGSFLELDMAKSPLSMTIIRRDQIRVSGSRHLSELLEVYVPGFQYVYNPWNGMGWSMRGVSNDRNTKFIVLFNGHKVNTESKDGFITETELGLLGDIERVEVLRGPAGLVYGSGAIAGIVNVVTRSPESNSLEVEFYGGGWDKAANDAHIADQKAFATKSFDVRAFWLPAEGQTLAASFGRKVSDGLGAGTARQWGALNWPYPNWTNSPTPAGVPSDGSYGKTDGNWRGSIDWTWDNFRLYARATHQEVENGAYFIYDPWKDRNLADSTAPSTLIDGKWVDGKDPFWSQAEGWGNQRRIYLAEQYSLDATYTLPFDQNDLKLEAAWDAATNRNTFAQREGYEANYKNEQGRSGIQSSFGERRYTLGAMMLWRDLVPRTQLATGMQQRFDDLGSDIQGNNISWKGLAPSIKPMWYSNTALFTEGFTDLADNLGVDYGLRWDGHTRTIDNGGTLNGKVAAVYSPIPHHTIKLIAQTSTNNGTVDNYEHKTDQYDEFGIEHDGPYFTDPTDTNSTAVTSNMVAESELHKLKPERSISFELVTTHEIGNWLYLSPSISYNIVQDMFAWAQPLMRVINSGEYHHMAIDLDAKVTLPKVVFGLNHAIQFPLVDSSELADMADTIHGSTFDKTKKGWYRRTGTGPDGRPTYEPVFNAPSTTVINPAADFLSDNGNFHGIVTNVSKAWIDYTPTPWLTLHTDSRIFWGLWGRRKVYGDQEDRGWNVWHVQEDPVVKLNAGATIQLPWNLNASAYAYDILGVDNGTSTDNDLAIHTLRWGQGNNDITGTDIRSYAVRVEKTF